ncbi:MAG TPA: restriction endonuclease subunit S, partial [Alcaligenaceae bacterium]|nr:restriction endonuclease subunit S [Alcaligenaceae bacterium]
MSFNWINTTVGEYSPFIYGKAIRKADQLSEGTPVYGSNGVYTFSEEPLSEQHAVIIGRKGSVGKVHLSTKPCWISDTAFYTTKDTIEEAYFVYYLLSSLGLEDMNTDAAVPGLNRNNAHRLEIKIPSTVEERVALVEPLINLDKKIELNRQTNQTLEQIAQAIFKSWFVDFEPT